MYTTHEARTISHLVACSSRGKVNETVDNIMPLPVVDRQREGDASKKSMPIVEGLTNLLLEHDTIRHCVLSPEG
jgi:hypothetical protein